MSQLSEQPRAMKESVSMGRHFMIKSGSGKLTEVKEVP
jgi:hypothetical protein